MSWKGLNKEFLEEGQMILYSLGLSSRMDFFFSFLVVVVILYTTLLLQLGNSV